jgi:hypothetical protein
MVLIIHSSMASLPTLPAPARADDKLRPVFGKDSVNMFELAGIVGKHLTP